ncbi:hypothetical protein TNCV_382701 [Trichonephila clavipes]|nr:hypothetical protein TNCV_382701 [Trichonephila clavipes]
MPVCEAVWPMRRRVNLTSVLRIGIWPRSYDRFHGVQFVIPTADSMIPARSRCGVTPENTPTPSFAPFGLLAGSVPPWFAQLSRAELDASGNGCIGSIPNSFSDIEDCCINCPVLDHCAGDNR